MADFGHSRLLKFFVKSKMADTINEANGIASAVPGEQKIRAADEQTENSVAIKDDFTLSPVITVTKKEASFTKGDLKLQKVTVTEDISDDVSIDQVMKVESMDTTKSEEHKISDVASSDVLNIINSETGEEVKKVSKIPRRRFRAAVNKVRSEQKSEDNVKRKEIPRRSSIPRLKENKIVPQKEETEKKRESINFDDLISNVTEEDFDKIYEEIVENHNVLDECESTHENRDPEIVETKFDEIIHSYDVNKIEPLKIDKPRSKIPLLKRKSEHDIEVTVIRKELQRKGSLGRIPINHSFGDKASSLPKIKTPQFNDNKNSLSKKDTEATPSDYITNNNLETAGDNVQATMKVTKIPLSNNKNSKISSIVLNKQPKRVNSEENNNLNQTDENACNLDSNGDKIADVEHMKQEQETYLTKSLNNVKLETFVTIKVAKSDLDAEFNDKLPLSPQLEDSIEVTATAEAKNCFNERNISDTDIKIEDAVINDGNSSNGNLFSNKLIINSENESVLYNNNEIYDNKETKSKYLDTTNTYYNNDYQSISKQTPNIDLKYPEPEITHKKESQTNNTVGSKEYCINELINRPKLNESEVLIKYMPEIRELKVTQDHYFPYNRNNSTNVDCENKSINNPNESLTRKPVKYKTITASQTVEETNEEDIIILKGKVSRVISRLDSLEPKQKKKTLDDLPKQSVKSKISLFECTDPKPVDIKNIPIKSNGCINHPKDDKPRVIEGILKDSNKIDDFKDLNRGKMSAKLENDGAHDRVKIAHGLKDKLARWEKNNTTVTATNIHNNYDNVDINKEEVLSAEDDVFGKKSADIINSYKLSQQKKNINVESDMKRAKSLAELDLGDAVTGKVKKNIYRMKSVDKIEHRKEIINSRERPRKGSVSERIALFEGRVPKAEPLKMSLSEMTSAPEARDNSERVAELAGAAARYGTFHNITHVEVGGVQVPALWVGTAMVESGVTKELVKAAIELGYRALDTAYIYGTERQVGEAIREKIADGTVKREDLFVAGKLWSTFHRSDLVEAACRESLDKLGLDYFDLYMIHNPMSFKEGGHHIPTIANVVQYSEHDYLDAWFGLETVVTRGLARAAGVSNFNTKQIQRILDKGKIRPVVNQVESHPYLTQLGLETFCSDHNIRLSVFGTLGSKGTPAPFKSNLSPAIDDPLVVTMAAGLGLTPAQLLISYQLTLGRAVVVKCSSGARLWENLQAQAAPLQPEHVRALHNLNRNQRTFTFKGMGDTHKNYPFTELL